MKLKTTCPFAPAAALLSTGCLVNRTVKVNGEVREQNLEVKRPIKEAIQNSGD